MYPCVHVCLFVCSYATLIRREPSLLLHRNRAKSLDGCIIHHPMSRPSQSSVGPKAARVRNTIAYSTIIVQLRRMRKYFNERESKRWNAFTGAMEKVVDSRWVREVERCVGVIGRGRGEGWREGEGIGCYLCVCYWSRITMVERIYSHHKSTNTNKYTYIHMWQAQVEIKFYVHPIKNVIFAKM